MELEKSKKYYGFILFLYAYGAFPVLLYPSLNYVKIAAGFVILEIIYRSLYSINNLVIKMLVVMGILWVYARGVTVYNEVFDYSYVDLLKVMLVESIIIGYYFASLLKKRKYSTNDVLDLLSDVIFAQSLIILIMSVSPTFRNIIWDYLCDAGKKQFYFAGRGLGISGQLFFDFAMFISLYMVLATIKFVNGRKFSKWDYFKLFIVLFSLVYTSRTSLVGFMGAIVVLLIRGKNSFKVLWKYIRMGFITYFGVLVLMPILPAPTQKLLQDKIFPWFFEWYYNYKETGKFSTSSSDFLFEKMYYWPDDSILVWGSGFFQSFGFFAGLTDAGYMRNILFFGIIGTIFLLSYYLYFFIGTVARHIRTNDMALFIFIYVAIMAVVHIKGEVFAQSTLNVRVVHFLLFFYILTFSSKAKHLQ